MTDEPGAGPRGEPPADPLYRPRAWLPADASEVTLAGVPVGVDVVDTDPTAADAQWMADRTIGLALIEPIDPEVLRGVLPAFLEHAAGHADRPAEAVLTLPSRDVDAARAARAAGFAPTSLMAVADLRRPTPSRPAAAGVATIRDADLRDAEAIAGLWCEQAEYEARVGTLRVSRQIRAAIAAQVPAAITQEGHCLVAETAGTVVGALVAQSPALSAWCTVRLNRGPVSYLAMASTTADARGGGVGTALVTELHRRHRAEGVALSALHYSAYNPLSVPFWSRQGYRPVLTTYGVPLAPAAEPT